MLILRRLKKEKKKKLLKSVQLLHVKAVSKKCGKYAHSTIYSECVRAKTRRFASQHVRKKMLKQNAVRLSNNAKLKCREFSTLQKREITMQRKLSVLQ